MLTETPENRMNMDVFSWGLNVSTSVAIVFANKLLMDPKTGFGFVFATTLCSLHFLSCAASVWGAQALGFSQPAYLGWKEIVIFSLVASASIASLNLSLLLNSIGFYQISKLLIIPFVCFIEAVWLKKQFTLPTLLSVLTVVIGVAIVTVTDYNTNPLGFIIAAISVVSSGMQQILCGVIQRKNKITSNQLLSNTAPAQGVLLLIVGPTIDKLLTDKWILDYQVSVGSTQILILSCTIAVAVNISQFMCLGRFSAVTFQVLGHTKTICVLLIGWLYFHDVFTPRKLAGMALAVLGMVAYGYFNSVPPTLKGEKAAAEKKDRA